MGPETILDRILDFIWRKRINSIEYYFAKRWLDKCFGEQEYWGDYISEMLRKTKELETNE